MQNISEVTHLPPEDERGELETRVYQVLNELKIPFERVDNDPVESMEACVEISDRLGTEIRKTVFVCDRKKTHFYLVVMPANKSFNTKVFSEKLDCPRVSFASPESMEEYLGVLPGTATIMSLLNDPPNRVKVIVDKSVAESDWFACNPGANTTHIKITTDDLLKKFLPYTGHRATIIGL